MIVRKKKKEREVAESSDPHVQYSVLTDRSPLRTLLLDIKVSPTDRVCVGMLKLKEEEEEEEEEVGSI